MIYTGESCKRDQSKGTTESQNVVISTKVMDYHFAVHWEFSRIFMCRAPLDTTVSKTPGPCGPDNLVWGWIIDW